MGFSHQDFDQAKEELDPKINEINRLSREESNRQGLALVQELTSATEYGLARHAIQTLFFDGPARFEAKLALAEASHSRPDVFALSLLLHGEHCPDGYDAGSWERAIKLIAGMGQLKETGPGSRAGRRKPVVNPFGKYRKQEPVPAAKG